MIGTYHLSSGSENSTIYRVLGPNPIDVIDEKVKSIATDNIVTIYSKRANL